MPINKLRTKNVRNLVDQEIRFNERFNVFYGDNGSGKTSVLEAVYLLCTGRSFRTSKQKTAIRINESSLVVYGEVLSSAVKINGGGFALHNLGVMFDKDASHQKVKVDGYNVKSLSELAVIAPVNVIDPQAIELLLGSPSYRRQFIDSAMFHVEPDYPLVWKSMRKALKQRNSLLRHGNIDRYQIDAWNGEFLSSSDLINTLRKPLVEKFSAELVKLIDAVFGDTIDKAKISFRFNQGWDNKKDLGEVLTDNLERDTHLGYTQYGPHRADIRVRFGGQSIGEVLSRGQLKAFACVMKIAMFKVIARESKKQVVHLLDDLASELDDLYKKKVISSIAEDKDQVLVTSVRYQEITNILKDIEEQFDLFHVEHGQISNENANQMADG